MFAIKLSDEHFSCMLHDTLTHSSQIVTMKSKSIQFGEVNTIFDLNCQLQKIGLILI